MSAARAKRPTCPTCKRPRPADAAHAPFCSERCKMIDLGRWFDEEYVLPGEDAVDFDGLAPPLEDGREPDAS